MAVGGELVDDLFEVFDGPHVGVHDVAVLASDASAFDDLGRGLGEVGHPAQLAWSGADPDHRAERITERSWVQFGVVAEDDAFLLEALETFSDCGRGQSDPSSELGQAHTSVGLELGQ